jgi:rhodanese-related sulfurtransferase
MSPEVLARKKTQTAGNNLVLIDAREPYEYRVSHLEGSRNLPLVHATDDQLCHVLTVEAAPNADVVTYCLSGARAGMMAEKLEWLLKQRGCGRDLKIYKLDGSIAEWALSGRPLVDENGNGVKEICLKRADPELRARFEKQ